MKRRTMFWNDPNSPLALDCELVSAVNGIVWKNIHRGFMGLAWKVQEQGMMSCFSGYFGQREKYSKLRRDLFDDVDAAKRVMFPKPLRAKCSSEEEYSQRMDVYRFGLRSRLVFVGNLSEHDVSESPVYCTCYAIFRDADTNRCLVYFFACD